MAVLMDGWLIRLDKKDVWMDRWMSDTLRYNVGLKF